MWRVSNTLDEKRVSYIVFNTSNIKTSIRICGGERKRRRIWVKTENKLRLSLELYTERETRTHGWTIDIKKARVLKVRNKPGYEAWEEWFFVKKEKRVWWEWFMYLERVLFLKPELSHDMPLLHMWSSR